MMTKVKIPLHTEDVTAEWLSQALGIKIDTATFQVTGNAHEGMGFLSNLLRVTCTEAETGNTLNLIVKLIPEAEEPRTVLVEQKFDQTEIESYRKILPDFCEAVPELELEKYLCKFVYGNFGETEAIKNGSVSSEYASVLILQDLKPAGFTMLDPIKAEHMTMPQIESGLDFMARLHCAGKVVEKQQGKYLTDIYPFVHTPQDAFGTSPFYFLLKQCFPAIDGILAEHEPKTELMDKIRADYQKWAPHTDKMLDIGFQRLGERWLVLNHGDLWPNNLLFKKSTEELKIIDWQLVNYSESVRDIAIFILSSLSPADLTKVNVQNLLGFYFEKYSTYCEQYGIGEIRSRQSEFEDLFYGLGIFHGFAWFLLSLEAYVNDIPRYLRCLEFFHVEMDLVGVMNRFVKL